MKWNEDRCNRKCKESFLKFFIHYITKQIYNIIYQEIFLKIQIYNLEKIQIFVIIKIC